MESSRLYWNATEQPKNSLALITGSVMLLLCMACSLVTAQHRGDNRRPHANTHTQYTYTHTHTQWDRLFSCPSKPDPLVSRAAHDSSTFRQVNRPWLCTVRCIKAHLLLFVLCKAHCWSDMTDKLQKGAKHLVYCFQFVDKSSVL